jgi:hypothetical protein
MGLRARHFSSSSAHRLWVRTVGHFINGGLQTFSAEGLIMFRIVQFICVSVVVATIFTASAEARHYYNKVPPLGSVTVGATGTGATPANTVPGKEYSHHDWLSVQTTGGNPNVVSTADHDAFGVVDPLQVVSWDGISPNTRVPNSGSDNAFDYGSGGFNLQNGQVDALANQRDALFRQVILNQASLLFSTTGDLDASTILPTPAGGGTVVYKAHVHWEDPVGGHGEWADIEAPGIGTGAGPGVNHHVVLDLDSLEVWGPEPPSHDDPANPTPVVEGFVGGFGNGPRTADADRFSLDVDSGSTTSVWAYNSLSNSVLPWIPHSEIVAAVEMLFLGPGLRFDDESRRNIDVDAIMARDLNIQSQTAPPAWDPGDELLFSIDPVSGGRILNPNGGDMGAAPPIDGGEIMHLVKTAPGPGPGTFAISYLKHGGHTWDTLFPVATTFGYRFEDVDALEAVGTLTGDHDVPTPEPASAVLFLIGLGMVGAARFSRG